MAKYKYLGKPIPRIDAKEKVTGEVKYPSDLHFDNQIYIRLLRSKYPYAKIKSINIDKAAKVDGVVKVLTYKDVPGLNGYGIAVQDQPVFCYDYVRFQGDAIAAVGAETEEIAKEALELIEVEYEVLKPVTTPEEALKPDAPRLHKEGNILNEKAFSKGDVEKAFAESDFIFEHNYQTQRQAHCYLETEAGAAYYDENNKLVVHVGGQYPHRDAEQLARILAIPEKDIRAINSPVGGGFGGKDELTVQPYVALMTFLTKRPSKMFIDREESFIAYGKRHPVNVKLKTGVNKDGKLTAIEFYALADTGGYASLGGPVFNLTIEHSGGVYFFPNGKISGHCMYTNSGLQVAFRGFGVPQSLFALETQMDEMADAIGMNRLEFRRINLLHKGQTGAIDNEFPLSIGSKPIIEAIEKGDIYKNREQLTKTNKPHLKRGIGYAVGLQGAGLGVGLPDFAHTIVELQDDGKFLLLMGTSEMGQGNATCFAQIAAEELNCEINDIKYILGDSGKVPDSGSATASRTIYAVGASIYFAAKRMREELLKHFNGSTLEIKDKTIYIDGQAKQTLKELIKEKAFKTTGEFIVPTAKSCLGDGLPHILYGYSGHIVVVEVNTLTGETSVIKAECYLDAGTVVNQQGLEGQGEGGFVMGVGYALTENSIVKDGYYQNPRFATYILPTAVDVPFDIKTEAVDVYEDSNPIGAKGIGEVVFTSVAPAITNAIHDAIGERFYSLPVTPEDILLKLNSNKTNLEDCKCPQ
ncbi:MAG: xanthine dehydrogenase family protein molybdopterin-binding subunit [Vampirovibrionia bacterium]